MHGAGSVNFLQISTKISGGWFRLMQFEIYWYTAYHSKAQHNMTQYSN